jgi:hypothetical protein
MTWLVLGFTADDVIGGWQDSRLAEACVRASLEHRREPPADVLQSAGDSPYLIHWYIGEAAARLFDHAGVDWRRFVVAERPAPPADATPALTKP